MSSTVTIQHSHGLTERVSTDGSIYETVSYALDQLRGIYGDEIEHEGDIREGRILVWRDEASAENDDGARAVASIRA